MADWNQPTNASAYTGVLTTLNEKIQNAAKMDFTGDTNLPTGSLRHDTTTNKFQEWNGSSWVDTTVHFGNRVGIGTTNPATTLEIHSTSVSPFLSNHSASGTAIAGRRFTNDANGCWLNLHKSRGTTIGAQAAVQNNDQLGVIYFSGSNGTDFEAAATITTAVDGTLSTNIPSRIQFTVQNGTTTLTPVTIKSSGNVGLGTATPSYQLQLSTDSAAKPTTNTWTIASDERIKTNIQPYEKGLSEILQIRPITYDYNGKGGIPAGPGGVSIIAQELQPIFPECIGSYQGKLEEEDEEVTEILNYNGHAITFALINAIKELSARVEALELQLSGGQ